MGTITVTIIGNTYPVKEQIKALGGRWDSRAKGWNVPIENADAARALVAGATQTRKRNRGYVSHYARFSSGAEVYTNKRGRCEDAPCCGCCS